MTRQTPVTKIANIYHWLFLPSPNHHLFPVAPEVKRVRRKHAALSQLSTSHGATILTIAPSVATACRHSTFSPPPHTRSFQSTCSLAVRVRVRVRVLLVIVLSLLLIGELTNISVNFQFTLHPGSEERRSSIKWLIFRTDEGMPRLW